MDYPKLIESMSADVYRELKRAVELGKWPDGRVLSPKQRQDAMQAVIAWGERHLEEHERVGFIDRGHKAGGSCDDPQETPLNWRE